MTARVDFARRVASLRARKQSDIRAELNEFGCPFDWSDPRATAWMDGYKAALRFAEEAVRS